MAKLLTLKVVRVGNSRGVRLPKALLERHAIGASVVVEERTEGVLLRAGHDKRLGWAETFKEMAREKEDWGDLDATIGDGLDPGERW